MTCCWTATGWPTIWDTVWHQGSRRLHGHRQSVLTPTPLRACTWEASNTGNAILTHRLPFNKDSGRQYFRCGPRRTVRPRATPGRRARATFWADWLSPDVDEDGVVDLPHDLSAGGAQTPPIDRHFRRRHSRRHRSGPRWWIGPAGFPRARQRHRGHLLGGYDQRLGLGHRERGGGERHLRPHLADRPGSGVRRPARRPCPPDLSEPFPGSDGTSPPRSERHGCAGGWSTKASAAGGRWRYPGRTTGVDLPMAASRWCFRRGTMCST